MQVEAIRSHWPRAVVMVSRARPRDPPLPPSLTTARTTRPQVRTMYAATYGGFGGDYGAYNALLREARAGRLRLSAAEERCLRVQR